MLAGPSSRSLFCVAVLHSVSSATAANFHVLGKRSHISGLTNGQNIDYSANITLNGAPFSVLIDTGSSDLWVAGTVPGSVSTGASAEVTYAIGSASGSVNTASLDFLGYTIPNQAFILVDPSSSSPEGQGVVGLGPGKVSQVFKALGSTSQGDAPVDNIFRQNMSSPNFVSVLLGRSDDPDDQFPGDITVGELVPGYENISSQPQVPVTFSSNQHWQVLLDPSGILGPDGQPINSTTQVSGTKDSTQLTAIFDTGFSLSQVPKAIADGIYGRFEGATYSNLDGVGGIWVLPCDIEVNVTILLGGHQFPMHPLDTNFDLKLNMKDSSGRPLCVGSLQPISTAASSSFDLVLGMSWLRNAYLLVDYGDFVDGTTSTANPFVQALSTTDPAEAHGDFVQVRLGGIDTTGGQSLLATPVDSSEPSTFGNSTKSWFSRHWVIIAIAGAATAGGLLLLTLLLCCCQRRRRRNAAIYRPLQAPAPMPIGSGMSYVAGYAPNHQPGASLGVPAGPRHSRGLSDTSTLLGSNEYETNKYDPHKSASFGYSSPWDAPHTTQ